MDTFSKNFRDWMDKRHLRAADVASALHLEPQTVRNWRASGIPKRRQSLVAAYMADFDKATSTDPVDVLRSRPLIIDVTPEQFHRWEAAALSAGKTLTKWAHDSLEELAAEQGYASTASGTPDNSLPLLADPGNPYRPHSSSGDATTASDIVMLPRKADEDIA